MQQDPEQIITVVLARAGYERRRIEVGKADEDGLATLIGVLESGIEMVLQRMFRSLLPLLVLDVIQFLKPGTQDYGWRKPSLMW